MLPIVFYAHSGIRYLVLLAAIAAVLYLLYGIATRQPFDKLATILSAAYVGLLDLQVLTGVLLYLLIPSYPALLGHVVMMLAAVTLAHVASIMNKRREDKSRGLAIAGVAGSLVLVVGGIMAIGRPLFGSSGLLG
jgi:ascorbate-specific PTS system EIIC-type component UlaA